MSSQGDASDGELDTNSFLEKAQRRNRKPRSTLSGSSYLLFSLTVNCILLACTVTLLVQSRRYSYENGFSSDLRSVGPEIRLTEYQFSGAVQLDHHGQFSVDHSGQRYVGEPTPEIDRAWDELLAGLNVDLDATELDSRFKTFQWPESGLYFTGLDVFHSLHCLNRLRQALHPDFYNVFSAPGDPSRHDHIGHCINQIRQALQCHADLTPMEWERVGDKIILNTATRHTCRDFDKISEWARQRQTRFEGIRSVFNGSLFVVD